ncbi:Hsp33 family molecular chaperone HslO [Sphingomonas sp. LT1P40]|uniref:Hsp33 family molecular chaperone HslO n=1 Tax=Alteristakelama amylovorans TaxID=3096166 RepID=UPI002FCA9458
MTTLNPAPTDLDRTVNFTLPHRDARGRVARLGPVLDAILTAHAYPPPIERLLAEALTLTALLGSTLKDAAGQLTLQAQTPAGRGAGIVSLLVCDYKGGELRGYVQFDAERLAQLGKNPSLYALFNQGFLAITFDQVTSGERYQGIVPLDGGSLAEAAESYFRQSEQIPSLVRLGIGRDAQGRCVAGGLFLQHLPEGEDGRERLHAQLDHPEWEHVEALGGTMGADELADPLLPLEGLVWRLFNEEDEVRVQGGVDLVRGCRCDPDYIAGVLAKFSPGDRAEMAEDGVITVDCAFCATKFPITVDSVA